VLVLGLAALLAIVDQPSEGTILAPHQPSRGVSAAGPGPATFYVSLSGADSDSGTSRRDAWQTISRVNQASLQAGDRVLFQGGQTFADAALNPPASGTAGAPIVFGSYGSGQATISQGAWFVANHLVFDGLRFGSTFYGGSDRYGTSNDVTLENSVVSLPRGNADLGVFGNGQGWTISGNQIENTGQSGLLLWGGGYRISGNTITNTGLDGAIPYNAHGIYLDAANSTITNNTITNFQESGISVRYRNSTIQDNVIANGHIGIDFFQTDPQPGTGHWTRNQISGTTGAGIYVSPAGVYPTRESFVITANAINPQAGSFTNIARTRGARRIIKDNSR
jgi:parallel beta-helix repeat protein